MSGPQRSPGVVDTCEAIIAMFPRGVRILALTTAAGMVAYEIGADVFDAIYQLALLIDRIVHLFA